MRDPRETQATSAIWWLVIGADAERIAAEVPGAESIALKNWGHFRWVGEQWQRMRAALVWFLNRHADGNALSSSVDAPQAALR